MAATAGEFQVESTGLARRAVSGQMSVCLVCCLVSAVCLGIAGCGETMSPSATETRAVSGNGTAQTPAVIAKAADDETAARTPAAAVTQDPFAESEPTAATAQGGASISGNSAAEGAALADTSSPPAASETGAGDTVPLRPAGSGNADDASPFADDTPIVPLKLGDAAPQLKLSGWAKGTPVESFAAGTVYVVEFWATWCGPCRMSMPHMSQLQAEYGEKVRFIGITNEDLPTVEEFMKQPGENEQPWSEIIQYAIALDERQEATAAYMQASGQQGIPAAFVVGRTGRVEWIGHPMGMDDPLREIVAGTWDVDARVAEEATLNEIMPVLQKAAQSEKFAEAIAAVDRALEKHPASPQFHFIKMQILLHAGNAEPTNQFVAVLAEKFTDDARMLEQIAWMLATAPDVKGIDFDLALKLASRASELTEDKNASIMDTIARVYYASGKPDEALTYQKKAVELEPQNPHYRKALKQYESEAAPSVPSQPLDPAVSDGPATGGNAEEAAPAPPDSGPAATE